ncbi:MAG: YciI family protein [Solirubrobacteraceae bacterium]
MRYMFLLFNDEDRFEGPEDPRMAEEGAAYGAFTGAVNEAGAFRSGDALQGSATATVVRAGENGTPLSTDGPFAETKEQLVGFYILECRDLDEAIEWAAKIPAAGHGAVEVRPIRELG